MRISDWSSDVCSSDLLRWLAPLNDGFIAAQAKTAKRILVLDEGRKSAGVGEGVITAIVEGGCGATPLKRVVDADTFTPLAGAALLVLQNGRASCRERRGS